MFRSWRQSVRELGERVERLEGELGRLNMENADLKSQLKERDARIAKLESVLEESRRAGKRQAAPFSKDKPKRDPKKPGRKPGSKYGRQAVRAIPVPDKTFEAPCPEQCPCGGKVGAEGSIDLYQVDIPPIQPETWKFVVGHGHCQECGRRVRGQHPLLISKAFEVGTVHFGPRLLAFAAFQKMICGVSYDKIRLGFEQMLGFPVARSTLCRAMQRLARRAKPTRDALVEALRASPVVYADETGWKQGGRRVWLWVFTNLRETVYEILPGRGFEQAASVLGKNYAGTLGVDGWAPYRCFKEATLQTCYNHLLHRCHELLETATRGAVRFPRLVKAILRHALALRDRRDAGEISPHGLRVAKGLLQAKMNRLLHGRFTNPANQRFAKHLRRYRDNLFVFLDRADVEATNYPAEQDIRIAVVNRKDLRRRQPYRERGTGPVDPHERPPELPSQRDPRDRHRHVNPSCSRQHPRPLGQPRAVNNYYFFNWPFGRRIASGAFLIKFLIKKFIRCPVLGAARLNFWRGRTPFLLIERRRTFIIYRRTIIIVRRIAANRDSKSSPSAPAFTETRDNRLEIGTFGPREPSAAVASPCALSLHRGTGNGIRAPCGELREA